MHSSKLPLLLAWFFVFSASFARCDDLYNSLSKGDMDKVKAAIAADPKAVNTPLGGRPPLHIAIWGDKLELVRFLLTSGADVKATDNGILVRFSEVPLAVSCGCSYDSAMSTLTEIESVVSSLTAMELAELERVVRAERMKKTGEPAAGSILNLPPLNLGQMLRPLGTRPEWHDEMLEGRG